MFCLFLVIFFSLYTFNLINKLYCSVAMAGDEKKPKLKILQVSNISIAATRDQIFSMCQYLGRIDDIKVSACC